MPISSLVNQSFSAGVQKQSESLRKVGRRYWTKEQRRAFHQVQLQVGENTVNDIASLQFSDILAILQEDDQRELEENHCKKVKLNSFCF